MRRIVARRLPLATVALVLGCLDGPTGPVDADDPRPDASVARAPGGGARLVLAALTPGDRVAVRLRSDGCFHRIAADVLLTRLDDGLAVEVVRASAPLAPGWRVVARSRLGPEELRGLDRLLDFYRSARPEGCTTVDEATFRVVRGELEGHAETHRDASCASLNDAALLPLLRLVPTAPGSAGGSD